MPESTVPLLSAVERGMSFLSHHLEEIDVAWNDYEDAVVALTARVRPVGIQFESWTYEATA
ncbi:MAG: hypothetical protein JWQ12_1191 [Glaciihabitans sp.]|jgi:hypothetical protein|nr:hypothetical protein [Glaciihabitans sp.]